MVLIGKLIRQSNGRWAIKDQEAGIDIELTCGSVAEVCIAGNWIRTCVEHDGVSYYATTPGVALVRGLLAKVWR